MNTNFKQIKEMSFYNEKTTFIWLSDEIMEALRVIEYESRITFICSSEIYFVKLENIVWKNKFYTLSSWQMLYIFLYFFFAADFKIVTLQEMELEKICIYFAMKYKNIDIAMLFRNDISPFYYFRSW